MKKDLLNHLALLVVLTFTLAIPLQAQAQKDRSIYILQCELDDLRQKVHCYQVERDILEEKIHAQGELIAKLQKEYTKSQNASEELSQGKFVQLEKRVFSLEQKNEGILADLKQLKTHANDTSSSLNKCSNKIQNLEQDLTTNVSGLKTALQALIKVVHKGSESAIIDVANSVPSGTKTYKVKSGDTLERIAKNNGLSVDALKKRNNLTKDRIVIGQELILEEPPNP